MKTIIFILILLCLATCMKLVDKDFTSKNLTLDLPERYDNVSPDSLFPDTFLIYRNKNKLYLRIK